MELGGENRRVATGDENRRVATRDELMMRTGAAKLKTSGGGKYKNTTFCPYF